MIKFTNLTKRFGDHVVLNGLSLEFRDGQTTVILGSSGSGKSTMLRCINLLEIPSGGELQLGEFKINFDAPHKTSEYHPFRAHTGMVFQSFNLFPHLNVLQNVIDKYSYTRDLYMKVRTQQTGGTLPQSEDDNIDIDDLVDSDAPAATDFAEPFPQSAAEFEPIPAE